jgi:hypothetical protein
MLVSLNGILQAPVTSFTVSGSTLTFASNLATGDVIDFVILLGNVLDLGTPSDGTVTNAKLAQDIISGETELAAVPADTDELLVSDAGTLKRVDYSYLKSTNTPAFSVYLSGNQSVSSNTDTKITFDSEHFDTDSAFASNKFTVPSGKAGKYFFVLHWNSNTSYSNEMFAKIFKNGSLIRQMRNQNIDEDGVECCAILDLADGDYIEGYARATNNATNVLASTDKTWFDGFKLIG